MKRWALIQDGICETVVEQNEQPVIPGNWLQVTGLRVGPGWSWNGVSWTKPTNPARRHISIGAFKDRLGMDALAIAVSTHPVCVALREMLYDRRWIDLDRPDAGRFLDMLVAANEPAANPLFPGSGPMTPKKRAQILDAPVQDAERP